MEKVMSEEYVRAVVVFIAVEDALFLQLLE